MMSGIGEKLLDLVYPPSLYCICCGNYIDETRTYCLCDHCITHIRWDINPPTEIKGLPAIRCCTYDIYSRTLIFSLKYRGNRYIARVIAEIMADRLEQAKVEFDVIVPVPLSQNRKNARGFNQAERIAEHLSERCGKEVLTKVLDRVRETVPMRGLSPEERERNAERAFRLVPGRESKSLRGKRVLLLDDFFTTGATGRACAAALRKEDVSGMLLIAFAAKY